MQSSWSLVVTRSCAGIAAAALGGIGLMSGAGHAATPGGLLERLLDKVPAVVAVEILTTDYSATPADGPMRGTARVLKTLKGPLDPGREFQFSESAWVGPTYKKGELRILFLEEVSTPERPRVKEWRVYSYLHAKTDFFVDKASLAALSSETLRAFLKRLDQASTPPRNAEFRAEPLSK